MPGIVPGHQRLVNEQIVQHAAPAPVASPIVPDICTAEGASSSQRVRIGGKFFLTGAQKFYVRGVSYGAFRPDANGYQFPDLATVDRDFAQMAANGINAVRIYTPPLPGLLDTAQRHGLRVMLGLSAEQYVGFLIDRKGAPDVGEIVRQRVRACAGHPALLCYALGNEIPAHLVRWIGPRRIERYLKALYRVVKEEDPDTPVTYVNYPTTEYLRLPFLDFLSFNVYLEDRDRLEAYLARLQNLAGDRPLLLSELGLDSLRNGQEQQALVLDWQVRTVFAAGTAGCFVYAWTDEWYSRGEDVHDWDFGITDRARDPKPALGAVRRVYARVPFPDDAPSPRISVVVCTFNGSRTIRECLEGLARVDYRDFEVIVVDDGSTDGTAAIVREYDVRLISTPNQGLSAARNTGLEAATGDIVAYLDDDAWPDPHWLQYLAHAFSTTAYAAFGGPNIPPPAEGLTANCVANAPGGPTHVLLSDVEAEHIPGCNMAFRRDLLRAVGGFDPQFTVAGDDVHVCWRLQEAGWKLGFCPAAMVWHHRRNSIGAFRKQQRGYGKAEAMLETRWPEKYNRAGHLTWVGRVYGKTLRPVFSPRARVYHGTWGMAPFQSIYEPAAGVLGSLALMPEWYLIVGLLAALSLLGLLWAPLLMVVPVLAVTVTASLVQASLGAMDARFPTPARTVWEGAARRLLTALLHLVQPFSRLVGRIQYGLTPWRGRGVGLASPHPRRVAILRQGVWLPPETVLTDLETSLRRSGVVVLRGGNFDTWDLEVHAGLLAGSRLLLAIEDHGPTTQLVRLRAWPIVSPFPAALVVLLLGLAVGAGLDGSAAACGVLGGAALLLAWRTFKEAAQSTSTILRATGQATRA